MTSKKKVSRKKGAAKKPTEKAPLADRSKALLSSEKSATMAGEHKGACMVPDPNGGPNKCLMVTQARCGKIKGGVWVDGDC